MGLHIRCHLVRVVMLSLLVMPGPIRAANRHWLPPVQVSHGDSASIVHTVRPGSVARSVHATVLTQAPANQCNINSLAADYLKVSLGTQDWATAWATAWAGRERFNWENPNGGCWYATDVGFVLDAADSAHAVWEEHQMLGCSGVGYKQRRSGWAGVPPAFSDQSPDTVNLVNGAILGGGSPGVFLEAAGGAGTSDDIVHVLWKSGGSIWHRAKLIGGSWGPNRIVTDSCLGVAQSPAFVVTADKRLHMVGTCIAEEPAVVRHLAFRLKAAPPDSAWEEVDDDLLDTYTVNPGGPGEPLEDLTEALQVDLAALGGGGTEVLHISYHVDSSSVAFEREVMYRRYDVGADTWSPRYVVTPPDGSRSMYPQLFVEADGSRHVMYVERDRRRWERYFDIDQIIPLCEHGTTDPGDFSATLLRNELRYTRAAEATPGTIVWSLPEPVTADMRTAFDWPRFVAEGDTLWVVFSSHDDDDLASSGQWYDGNVETWFRKGIPMPQTTIASGESLHWNGEIYLDRDFVVQAGGRLIIDPGTAIVAAATDSLNVGRDASRVELIVRGTLEVNGEGTERVKFRSVDQDSGDWAGILFDLAAVQSGYGYTCASYLNCADISDATQGVSIRQTGAPSITNVLFSNITGERHITLDSTDVYVPYGGSWLLSNGTVVVVSDTTRSSSDEIGSPPLNPGKVDLVVHGRLDPWGAPGDPVRFEPAEIPPSTTDGGVWGGIFVDWVSAGATPPMEFRHVDVGYARTPLTLYFHDAIIKDWRVHHFRDRGIFLKYSMQEGPEIRGCQVFRDTTGTADLLGSSGREGIVLDNCSDAWIEGNGVNLLGGTSGATSVPGAGIAIVNAGGKYGFCYGVPADADSVRIQDNVIVGPGGNADTGNAPWSGLNGTWACGNTSRQVLVAGNAITGWNGAGVSLTQGEDLQFTCNDVDYCATALDFSRDDLDSIGVRFKTNSLRIADLGGQDDQEVVRTDTAPWLRLGPLGASTAGNRIEARGPDVFIVESDASASTLNAAKNQWRRAGTTHTDPDSIQAHIVGQVAVDSALVGWSPCVEMGAEAQRQHGLDVEDREVGPTAVAEGISPLPERTELMVSLTSRHGVEIRFALAGAERRRVEIDVFNVAGRRVNRLVDADVGGGRYGALWRGADGSGGPVASGVYLIRMRAGKETRVEKALLLR